MSLCSSCIAGQLDLGGQASLELRNFFFTPEFPQQKSMRLSPSATFEPELVYEWNGGDDRFTFTPFVRLDNNDKRRSHVDIREASWLHFSTRWDVAIGISKVFWGVTESVHLVDIINQSDAVEDITAEEKLGQPMINFNTEQSWGILSLFALPAFRNRTFTADNARLHGSLAIDVNNPIYESNKKERHMDWAARWSQVFGNLDIAVSHFQGTSREARLLPRFQAKTMFLVPFYEQIGQTGLELQLTTNNTLWKAEAISRTGHGKRFYAGAGGFEHSLYGIADSNVDIGLLLEYLYDGRDATQAPVSIADNDVFAGMRIAMNDAEDTAVLFGGMFDHHSHAIFLNLEAERRLTNNMKLEINSNFLLNVPDYDPLAFIRNDDFLEITVNWFF
ncbi:MAG: hypothetical protein R8L53_07580 [Mariprofundales bacterium]